MSRNPFKSKKNELAAVIRDALAEGLPPLFRVHRELIKRADPKGLELSCYLETMAKLLGYEPCELEIFLNDLAILNFIDYQIQEDEKLNIRILVH